MRKAALAVALALATAPAVALTPDDAQQKCEDVREAAEAGKQRAINAAIPKKDPGKTFDDATQSCLKNIIDYSKFEFRMPTLGDLQGALKQMGQDLLLKACQAAQDQFNRAVADATSQLGDLNTNLPGYGSVGLVGTGRGSVSVGTGGVTISDPPIAAPAHPPQSEPGLGSRLINWIRGGDDKKGGKTP